MMRSFCFMLMLATFCGAYTHGYGQTINLSDSLYHVLKNRPVPTGKLDTRNSFITGKSAKVYGIKAGLSFKKTLTIGIGYNWIGTDLTEPIRIGPQEFESEIRMRYVAPFIEYSFYKKGNWEAMVPVQLGFGKSFHRVKTQTGDMNLNMGRVVLYEPGMSIEYKIFGVVGIGGGFGYRLMLRNNKSIDQQFTSPVYVIRFRLIFDEILRQAKAYQNSTE